MFDRRELVLILSSFICGFYVGYINASSFCDPIVDLSIEHILPISIPRTKPIVDHEASNTSITIQSNLFDETYEWMFFKNRNTETSPYLIPKHKIIFCGIPKNAISMWKMVLLRLNALEWWLPTQRQIHAAENGLGSYRLMDKNWAQVDEMMNDPTWYKAVFIRDPLERALSAVLDKGFVYKIKWETFIEYLQSHSPLEVDQHFRPQHQFCDLYKYHKQYHIFAHNNPSHKKMFFDDNGLWDKYGSSGWSREEHEDKPKHKNIPNIKGNFTHFENVFRRHSLGSTKKLLRKYTIPQLSFLLKYYQYDYILFNISIPHWICYLLPSHYEQMTKFVSEQSVKTTAIKLRRTTNVGALRDSIKLYAELIELYSALNVFPNHLHPPCMYIITDCVEYGLCLSNFTHSTIRR
eukprot:621413_1